jgi:hypothetical protein
MLSGYVLYRGRRCRVLDSVGGDVFRVLDTDDTVRVLHRSKFQPL